MTSSVSLEETVNTPGPVEQELATALLGPLYAGWSTQLLLTGIFLAVFVNYQAGDLWAAHSNKVRTLLWTVAFLLTLQAAFCWTEIFWFGVRQEWTVERILAAHWPTTVSPLLTAIIGTLCTSYLTLRASAFFASRWARRIFCTIQFFFILVALLASVSVTAIGFLYLYGQEDKALPITFNMSVSVWLFCSMFVDVAVSLALLYNLRSRIAGFNPATDSLLRALVQTAIRTAAYTAVVSIAGAVVSVSFHEDNLYTTDIQYALWYPLSALYGLSLFTTLYSRKVVNRQLGQSGGGVAGVGGAGGAGRTNNYTTMDMQNVNNGVFKSQRRATDITSQSSMLSLTPEELAELEHGAGDGISREQVAPIADCYLCPTTTEDGIGHEHSNDSRHSGDQTTSRGSNRSSGRKIANLFVPHIDEAHLQKKQAEARRSSSAYMVSIAESDRIGQARRYSRSSREQRQTMTSSASDRPAASPSSKDSRPLSPPTYSGHSVGGGIVAPSVPPTGPTTQSSSSSGSRWTFANLGFGPAQPRVVRQVMVGAGAYDNGLLNDKGNVGSVGELSRNSSLQRSSPNKSFISRTRSRADNEEDRIGETSLPLKIQVHTTSTVEWEDEDGNRGKRERMNSIVST
ncbi:hypothetical protein OIO90_004454 [Microbotryomycetes sp. JL221]|nr:hypothetical protein OIO90_004454 [Microbotryomycetes sp. JL221]